MVPSFEEGRKKLAKEEEGGGKTYVGDRVKGTNLPMPTQDRPPG